MVGELRERILMRQQVNKFGQDPGQPFHEGLAPR
jgi:hypothetical protein